MSKTIKSFLKSKRGDAFFMMIICSMVIFIFFMLAFEVTKVYTVMFDVETNVRRLANNAVEKNIDNEWRRDGYNFLNEDEAKEQFRQDFNNYTMLEAKASNYLPPHAGFEAYGCKYSGDGEFLYMVEITKLTTERGARAEGATSNTVDPYLKCEGFLYIMPSIPGEQSLKDAHFIFKIPINLRSTNFSEVDGRRLGAYENELGDMIDEAIDIAGDELNSSEP